MVLRPAYVQAVSVVSGVVVTFGIAGAFACGTEPVGVDACRQIETARCENAKSCGIDLSKPVHRRDGNSPEKQDQQDVGACKRFYDEECLHGLVTTVDPGAIKTQACVDAINNATDCDIVKFPEKSPACDFLLPPAAPATAADAATE
ncbi:MAG: hypothetical protein JWP87_6195 [Labilithrix sp.]|nr:hypothetical protein [Labilithrix sp.]